MKKRLVGKGFIYFLFISFLLMMNGFPMGAEAKEKVIPIGEMVSKGDVKFEARENVWKEVESSYFPIFQGSRIKTENGVGIIALSNNSQIEVSPNSLFSFDPNDQFVLSQGNIEFRIPPSSEINFRVGNLSILKSRTLQATKNPSVSSPKDEGTMGSISIHSNGSVTIKSIQGRISILNQDHVVLAALTSKDSVTIPSITVGGPPSKVMVAQAPGPGGLGGAGVGGLSLVHVGVIVVSTVAIATFGVVAGSQKGAGKAHCP